MISSDNNIMAKNSETKKKTPSSAVLPLIKDPALLFRYSGMIDSIRDTAKSLIDLGNFDAHQSSANIMANNYMQLKADIYKTLDDSITSELKKYAPDLGKDGASMSDVYVAAATLSSYLELVYQTPKFVLSEKAQELGMREVEEKILKGQSVFDGLEGLPGAEHENVPGLRVGQYL